MTTLERIESLEKTIKSQADEIAQLKMSIGTSKVEGSADNGSALELAELANNRLTALEAGTGTLAKTVTAIAACLNEKNIVTAQSIMDRIIKTNQDQDQEEVNEMIQAGMLVKSEVVKPFSFVVASHTIVDIKDPASSKVVMERRLLRLPTMLVSPQIRNDLVNRKVGDQVQINKTEDGKVHVLTVKEIYDLNEEEVVRQGEALQNVSENREV